MDARRNRYSLRSGPNSRTTETGNQPFLDLSNFNLTPIETLRKLCSTTTATATTTTSSAGTSSNLHCSLPKSPISGSKSDSKSSKPCNDNSTDAKSETSVGSSTFVQVPNPSRFGISTPVRVHSSPTSSASGNGELAAYGQRKAIVLPCSSNFLKNKSGKGEVVAEPGLPPRSNKGKEKVTVKPFNCLHPENKKGDSEMVAKLASSVLSDGNKGKGKGIVENVSLLPAKNKKDRGKENFEPLSSSPPKNNKDTGNAILSISSYHGNKNKGKDIVEHVSELSTEKKKNKGKETFEFLGSPPPKSKDRGKAIVNIGNSCEKTMGEEISDVSLKSSPSKKTRGKRKSDTSAFSCPPLPKTRNVRKKINEVGDVELPGSRTVPNTKKSRPSKYQLPKEFVEEKRAYFKEIDEFELPEEEASD